MHSAPSVSYPVGRSRFQGACLALVLLISAVTGWLWLDATAVPGWRMGVFCVVWLMTGVAAIHAWWVTPQGNLSLDGQEWHWKTADEVRSGLLRVHLDLQGTLLLSLETPLHSRVWLWPERHAQAARWLALRQAVFSRVGVSAGDAASRERAQA
jgi:toxin CptA